MVEREGAGPSEFEAIHPRPARLDLSDPTAQDLFFLDRGIRRSTAGKGLKQDQWRNGGGKRAVITWPLKGREGETPLGLKTLPLPCVVHRLRG